MDSKDEELVNAQKLIIDHCKKSTNCAPCIFNNGRRCTFDPVPERWEKVKPKPKLTEFMKELLKNINTQYKWIAKDKDGSICVFNEQKPVKNVFSKDTWANGNYYEQMPEFINRDLFDWLSWDDNEPCYIPDLIKED